MQAHHGVSVRGSDTLPRGLSLKPGKFGRMFAHLPPFRPEAARLVALGKAMIEADPLDEAGDNVAVPAGFTYLGQFIDHDITFDTTPLTEAAMDPLALDNFRSPKLDLDCLYGLGPAAQPYLYTRESKRTKFALGRTREEPDRPRPTLPSRDNDLPRLGVGTDGATGGFALIGDPRNDENLIVAQTHVAFLKFHNKVVDHLGAGATFPEARRTVVWHYQWIVLHDFLARLIEPPVLDDVLVSGRRFYTFCQYTYIPVEFSAAAYRLGHAMVREQYNYNRIFPDAKLFQLLLFTGLSGTAVPVPSNWIIDWRRFFKGLPKPPGLVEQFNFSRKLDPLVAPKLHDLPLHATDPDHNRLPVRNLLRGVSLGLPSGQTVARYLGAPVLTPDEIATGPDGQVAREQGFDLETPLWYYVLKEAQVLAGGARLGPVGSRILAEVFVGLLQGDPGSFLSLEPNWRPTLPAASGGTFTMADLLTLVNELNPIGD